MNPNTPAPEHAAGGVPDDVLAAGLDGPLATRVAMVLERVVNPSIASHGGRADLVAMDEDGAWPTCASRGAARAAPCRG